MPRRLSLLLLSAIALLLVWLAYQLAEYAERHVEERERLEDAEPVVELLGASEHQAPRENCGELAC